MLQRLVANWLKQQAQDAVMGGLQPESNADDSSASDEPSNVDVLCVFPTPAESGGLVDRLSRVRTTKCQGFMERIGELGTQRVGVLEVNATHETLSRVVRDALTVRSPAWVISSGCVFALQAEMRRGQVVVADRIIDRQGYSLATGTKMASTSGVHVGTLLTLGAAPQTLEEKAALGGDETIACEIQAAVIAEVCRVMKTRMLAVHIVAEALGSRAPGAVKNMKAQDSWVSAAGAAAGALLEKPSSVKDLWKDKEQILRLSDKLATFLVGVLGQLGE